MERHIVDVCERMRSGWEALRPGLESTIVLVTNLVFTHK